jgi:PAS domain S-box-containing protein
VADAQDNLATILDHVADGVTVQAPGGRLIYANTAAALALGFASPAELLAAPLSEILGRFALFDEAGEPLPLSQLPGRRALAGEAEPSVTIRFHNVATGEERWSAIRASPVRDDAGGVRFAVNVWQDVTGDKRADIAREFLIEASEALASSLNIEATLANIAQLAVPRLADWCAVHLVRADGQMAELAVAHSDPEKIALARELQERYPADPNAAQSVAGVVRTGQPVLIPEITETMLEAAAQDEAHLAIIRRVGLTSAIIVPMIARGRVLGAISFVAAESGSRYDERDLEFSLELARRAALAIDNAQLYDAERAARILAQSAQARFQTVFEGVPDAILVVDGDGRYIEANTAAVQLLNYRLEELAAMRVGDLSADPQNTRTRFAQVMETGDLQAESEVVRKDGARVPVEAWWRRVDLPTGPIGIGVLRDISARIATDQIREEVLAAISHDLRNPLGSIRLNAQSLRRLMQRSETPDLKRLDDGLAAIDAMSTRVASLLEDIVDVARSRGDEAIPYAPEPTDLVGLVSRCLVEASGAAEGNVRLDAEIPEIVGQWDPRGIERIVLNLVNNALKYNRSGGQVTVRCDLTEQSGHRWAVLTVQDEGIGIPAADLPLIFERYRRGRNVGPISGTGLGLTGAKQIVDRHGGTINIASREGIGTTVTVRLPIEPEGT